MPAKFTAPAAATGRAALAHRYRAVRAVTNALCEPLSAEDMVVQVAAHASPAKWHLAHTTWFFETFLLERFEKRFTPYNEAFRVLFNSYYVAVGDRHPRDARGVLTRPGVGEVMAYRDVVDDRVAALIGSAQDEDLDEISSIIELGLNHEQQHQELILMDIRLTLGANPIEPPYRDEREAESGDPTAAPPLDWIPFEEGVVEIGADPLDERFAYDNEGPRHRRFLEPFEIASRCITCAEYTEFIEDGAYKTPSLWLDEGWTAARHAAWDAPDSWRREGPGQWSEYTLHGRVPVDPHRPVCHLSFFEADAFARWAGARLPTEAEWEHAADDGWDDAVNSGRFLDSGALRPAPAAAAASSGLSQTAGDVWEWTRSAHEPYPGYAPPEGAIGEYNGKFMSGQFVLRGGSFATDRAHIRRTYRNFFHPEMRWHFAGLRLARS